MGITNIGPFIYERFKPGIPPLEPSGRERLHHGVVIVGAGPVGMATALGLARYGIASVIIEADDSVCEGSRAACISRRSLEILARLGVAQAFVGKGLAWTSGRSFYKDEEVYRLEMPTLGSDRFPPMINLQQYYIEQFLLDEIAAVNRNQPGTIEVRWQSRVTALRQDPDSVELRVECPLGTYTTQADWLVACDGGQSFVRNSLGLELKGVGYLGRYAIVDIELASEAPTERRAWFDPPWARGTTILMHQQPDNIWRIDYQLSAGQDPDQVFAPEQLRAFVQTHLDAIGEGHLPWQPVWTSIYRAGAMTLDSYRHQRILFAGNSAHAMPIFGVRGLNSGFDDADNLTWKLASVMRKQAGDALLDTYSDERIQAFHVNAASAMRSTEFMSPPNRGFELMREAALSLAAQHPGIARLVNPRQTQAISYEHSALSVEGDRFQAGPVPGAPLQEAALEGGGHLTELLASAGFTLFGLGNCPAGRQVEEATRAADWPTLPCVYVPLAPDGAVARLYGAGAGSAYLVRPDGHVCGRWLQPTPESVLRAIRKACQLEGVVA